MTVKLQREFQASDEFSVAFIVDINVFMVNNRNKILKRKQVSLNPAFT